MVLEMPLLAVPVGPDLHDVDHRVVGPKPQVAQGGRGGRASNEITRLEGSYHQDSEVLVTFLSAHH